MNNELLNQLVQFRDDPLGFVLWAFPWGKIPELSGEGRDRPFQWHVDVLTHIRERLISGEKGPIRVAVASGHGIGKSAFAAWIMIWAVSTFELTRGITTATTDTQLRTKTWVELSKWWRMSTVKELLTFTATSLAVADKSAPGWRLDAIPWSVHNSEAFQGMHNQGRRILLLFDEASGIDDGIWEVAEGALTDQDTEIFWIAFGNPTKNTGRFKECFGKYRDMWWHRQVDSREVPITNKELIETWRTSYGEDSDFFKVRVRGVFPSQGQRQFIPVDWVDKCTHLEILADPLAQYVLAVDPARSGSCKTVFALRRGRRIEGLWKSSEIDTMVTAARIVDLALQYKPAAVVIDSDGMGGPIVDRCRMLGVRNIIEFHGAEAPYKPMEYFNRRTEVWGELRNALREGISIPNDADLYNDLIGVELDPSVEDKGVIRLLSKKSMIAAGTPSPDCGDAVAYSFAVNPIPLDITSQHVIDYRPRNKSTGY